MSWIQERRINHAESEWEMRETNFKIAYYITPHGFGHAVRSLEVIRTLMATEPEVEVIIVSDLPEFLIEQNLDRPVTLRNRKLDIGLVQLDSLQFDLEATYQALNGLYEQRKSIVAEEVDFLLKNKIRSIVSDIPFLVFHAAKECGIPSFGLGNFTWDWIYQAYAARDLRWGPLIEWIREGYSKCDLFLQLPMHGDCSVCPHIEAVPLIARRAKSKPEATREILGCAPEQKAYLISFYSLQLDREALNRIERIDHALFYYKYPISYALRNGRCLDDFNLSYVDVVAAMDGVITKPGYGIVADCLAHGTPMIYADRGFFPEYDILVRALEDHLNAVHLPSADLYGGRWETCIRQLESQPRRNADVRADGAGVCAGIIRNALPLYAEDCAQRLVVMPIEDWLDLHTFQPKEVKDLLDDYLEAAYEKGFKEVRIIHGKGSGVLRKTVHSILSRHPRVASFSPADSASGGWGATIAVFTVVEDVAG